MPPKTLVVPLDGSEFAERALPVAASLAQRIGGGLLLVSAQYHGPVEPRRYLEEQAERGVRCPVDVLAIEAASASDAIIEAVESDDDRVVCMTTHGRGRLRWATLGSVAEEVIGRADRPTLLVGRNCQAGFLERSSHLLVCTDGGNGSAELAPAALEWAAILGLDLRAAVVVSPLDIESAEEPTSLLDPIAAQFGGKSVVEPTILTSGFAAGALADYADDISAALMAISCHGRVGLDRLAFGSVTMAVLHLASCPVLVTHRAA